MTDAEIAGLTPQLLGTPINFTPGVIDKTYPAGTPLYVKDVLMLRLILENWNHRPIYYAITAGNGNWMQLDDYLTQEALLLRVNVTTPPDTSRLRPGVMNVPLDVPRTDSLVWDVYRYGALFDVDSLKLDPTSRNIATNLSFPYYALGQAYAMDGDEERSLENFRKAIHLSRAFSQIGPAIEAADREGAGAGDTGR
jgi:hypothetical protein